MAEEDEEDAVKTPAEQPPVGQVVPEDSYGGSPAVESKHLPVGVADVFSDDQAGSLFRPGVYRRRRTLLWRPFQASSLHHHHRAAASFLATPLSLRWRRLGPRIRPGEKLLVPSASTPEGPQSS
ncbi:unnamed protein product [Arctogadus glacialis]